jgi:prepilin-type N-terminal cleavage/methylation domain-containing protein/prepilin-type processing-associated H-X9-DG protein
MSSMRHNTPPRTFSGKPKATAPRAAALAALCALALALAAHPARAAVSQDLGVTVPDPSPWARATLLATDAAGNVYACDGEKVYRLVGSTFQAVYSGVDVVADTFVDPSGFAVTPDGSRAYVATGLAGRLVEVNLAAGTARELSGARLRQGFSGNYGVAIDPLYATPLVTDAWGQNLYAVGTAGSGTLTLVDTFSGTGKAGGGMAFAPDGTLIVPVPTSKSAFPTADAFAVTLYRHTPDWLAGLAAGSPAVNTAQAYAADLTVSGTLAVAADDRGHAYMVAEDGIYHASPAGAVNVLDGDTSRNIWSSLFEGDQFMAAAYDPAAHRLLYSRRWTGFDEFGYRTSTPWTLRSVYLLVGDMNGDGLVDAADNGPLVQALAAPASYAAAWPHLDAALLGDSSGNLVFNSADLAVDAGAGGFVVDYAAGEESPLAQVAAWVAAGCAGGAWTGPGIASSAAAADTERLTAVGIIDNADPVLGGRTEFLGQPVDATSLLVRYTWLGDTNLDGAVDADDYDVIDNTFVFGPGARGMGWWSGDFNYDGLVDADDYDAIDNAFVFGSGPLAGTLTYGGLPGGAPAAAPEPATLALLAAGAAIAAARRRRALPRRPSVILSAAKNLALPGRSMLRVPGLPTRHVRCTRRERWRVGRPATRIGGAVRAEANSGFTLVELIVVIAIIGILCGILAPALAGVLDAVHQTACASNLRQVGMALQLYLKDSGGAFFPLVQETRDGKVWYFGMERAGGPQTEGLRTLDRTRGRLYPYLQSAEGVEACPAVPFGSPYKPKFAGGAWSYGINYYLSSHNAAGHIDAIRRQDLGRTVLLADCAQVNTWLAPASSSRPMVEDHYWIRPQMPMVQFRHAGRANVLFADWHVEAVEPVEGSLDPHLPQARIGWFDHGVHLLRPRGAR